MAMTTYSSSTYKANEDGGSHRPRDVSFSSYLDSNERDFVRNLAASVHIQSPARESSVTPRACLGRTRFTRPELGVFGAEKYFNQKLDDQKCPIPRKNRGVKSKNNRYKREKTIDILEKKSTLSTITSCTTTTTSSSIKSLISPSYKSEGSWNSQFGTKILNGLQCKGTCIDKESIDTIVTQDIKVQSPSLQKGDNKYRESKVCHQEHFAFPIIQSPNNHLEDLPRKSLEIFGFRHIGRKQDIAQNLERKLSTILTWDAIIPNSQNGQFTFPYPFPFPNNNNNNTKKTNSHDARSEASSDLFEIENISGIPASQSSYATSEASVEWSVVTASAADFSVVSEYRVDEKMDKKMGKMEKMKVQKNSSTLLGGGLLGCRNHKSVDVVRSINANNTNNKKI